MAFDLPSHCDRGPVRANHGTECPRWCAYGASYDPKAEVPYAAAATTIVEYVPSVAQRLGIPGGQMRAEETTRGAWESDTDVYLETQRAEEGVRALLRLMGEDPDRDGIRDTPARVVKAYRELAARPGDPAELLSRVFGDVGQGSEMICVPGIQFVSLCEHHLLPFTGTAAVAYIPQPNGDVVGLSKIPRLVHHWAMRPQVQERLTRQIADSLEDALHPLGVAVRISSAHSCMSLRGVRAQGASMVTTDLRGRFLENPATRAEFLDEARAGA